MKKVNELDFASIQVKPVKPILIRGVKRTIDILVSLIGLVITFPVIVFFCILIRFESPGPAIFTQERVGIYGKEFKILKIRSMRSNHGMSGRAWTEKEDARITKVGKIIRKFRIDELPQFINVLKGDMSLIGPRPETPYLTEQFEKEIPGFKKRLLVKPGISGWAQVNGGYEHTPIEKCFYDLEYINNYSLTFDLRIAFKTIAVIFTGDGSR